MDGDVQLAGACARGDRAAMEALDAQYFPRLDAAIARIDSSAAFAAEVKQVLRERLFFPADGKPRIADYAGQGPLVSWLRAAAVRIALNLKRPERAREDVDVLEALPLAGADPELQLLRERHRPAFKAAFREALAELPARERTVLKMQLVDGLSLEGIGSVYGVNKSTVSRWAQKALDAVVDGTRRRVAEQLALDSAELESLIRLVRSGLEISVAALLDD